MRQQRVAMLACTLSLFVVAAFAALVAGSTQAGAHAPRTHSRAAIINVTNTGDSGPGSLRDAIEQAAPGDTINFTVTGTINLTSDALTINKDLTISGPGADTLSVERNPKAPDFKIFTVERGATVAIYGLSIRQGRAAASSGDAGGGIDNNGTLTLDSCRLTDNFAVDGGGGIHNAGTMSLTHCRVAANISEGVGGGISNDGMLTVSESVVEHNEALGKMAGAGGGIANTGTLTLNNSTISSNFALIYGGALYNSGQTTINKSTIMENVCGAATVSREQRGGGGVYNKEGGKLGINASTIARNSTALNRGGAQLSPVADGVYNAGDATVATSIIAINGGMVAPFWDVEGVFVSQGYNLIGRRFGNTGFARGVRNDLVGFDNVPLDPLLGALRDNGGPTPTAALLCNSPAIDAGDDASTEPPLSFATDQRGRARRAGAHVDIGAFEVQPDDEHCRVLSISDATVVEGDSGKKLAVFNVSLSAATADGVAFHYATSTNAASGLDYEGQANGFDFDFTIGNAFIAGGQTSASISVPVNGDTIYERDETFIIRLTQVTNAILRSGRGVGTIINDDPSPVVQFSAADYQAGEAGGHAVITVTRTGNTTDGFAVNYATLDAPDALPCRDTTTAPHAASARCDYTTTIDTLNFAPGQVQQSFNVPIVDDAYAEPAETFKVVLIAPGGLVLGSLNQATVTIGDNDTEGNANPIDDSAFFVRQHYLDFLNREPEQAGFDA
ncbi:MAG TPA: choice-of-anchor Q domain-containing protein, partial [Pyrinomonadaceae bacterium]|nr:choice-of-anchor Q domain-containing protein [Pyrinomonadaceae bacterium]